VPFLALVLVPALLVLTPGPMPALKLGFVLELTLALVRSLNSVLVLLLVVLVELLGRCRYLPRRHCSPCRCCQARAFESGHFQLLGLPLVCSALLAASSCR